MAASSLASNLVSFLWKWKAPAEPKAPPPSHSHLSVSSYDYEKRRRDGGTASLAMAMASGPGPHQHDASAVMCPSLAYANTLYFRSAYNVQVLVEDNEPEDRLLNRFRREVMRAGIIQECKRRRFYENKQEEKKRKTREAAKRNRRRRPPPRFSAQFKPDEVPTNKRAEDDDNWDLPEGGIP